MKPLTPYQIEIMNKISQKLIFRHRCTGKLHYEVKVNSTNSQEDNNSIGIVFDEYREWTEKEIDEILKLKPIFKKDKGTWYCSINLEDEKND